eukprot:m.587740 g.587740  ORF g.587740 m.587740 type:complete len:313 (-) comp22356_c0_seq1:563-1501(-)
MLRDHGEAHPLQGFFVPRVVCGVVTLQTHQTGVGASLACQARCQERQLRLRTTRTGNPVGDAVGARAGRDGGDGGQGEHEVGIGHGVFQTRRRRTNAVGVALEEIGLDGAVGVGREHAESTQLAPRRMRSGGTRPRGADGFVTERRRRRRRTGGQGFRNDATCGTPHARLGPRVAVLQLCTAGRACTAPLTPTHAAAKRPGAAVCPQVARLAAHICILGIVVSSKNISPAEFCIAVPTTVLCDFDFTVGLRLSLIRDLSYIDTCGLRWPGGFIFKSANSLSKGTHSLDRCLQLLLKYVSACSTRLVKGRACR